ncbi:hypothetical protein [uncultured Paraglaciecola sp.]|uniref:hypothetical protein n=1 Tax=uncultured Paraglaciecola sp. TaxID=1765024 RepID=UPI0026142029|nr:hypothetical protein [uncultured Paraglaciecola sp.]
MSATRLATIECGGVDIRAGKRYRIASHHSPDFIKVTVSDITKKSDGIVAHYRRKYQKLHNSIRLNQICGIRENWADY